MVTLENRYHSSVHLTLSGASDGGVSGGPPTLTVVSPPSGPTSGGTTLTPLPEEWEDAVLQSAIGKVLMDENQIARADAHG